jgi:serine/threonine-protein kinase
MEALVTLNGRYQLLDLVGRGGMATVYRAQDMALGRIVAVKVLHDTYSSDQAFLARFQQEAHAAANLTHPNIVTVHDIGQDGSRHYIVMEHVQGSTLKQIVRDLAAKGSRMPVNRALDLTIQICSGIGYAHRANLVHCDVKPQNILVTHDDRLKVADFGIARAMSGVTSEGEDNLVWGTPQYFAPEQAVGDPPTPASDVYAIGIVLFELLAGDTPFHADTPTKLALKHMQETAPIISSLNPAVPRQLGEIIRKVLSKEPAGRYRTAGQLGRILSSYRKRSQERTAPLGPLDTRPPGATISEQKTVIHQRPAPPDEPDGTVVRPPGSAPVRQPRLASSQPVKTVHIRASQQESGPDWVTLALGIAALIALIGLMPLWYFVYRAFAG